MTAKMGNARSYLAQLAEPVPQGDPAFSVRRDLLAPAGASPVPPPLILDVVENGAGRPAVPGVPSQPRLSSALDSMRGIRLPASWHDRKAASAEPVSAQWPATETSPLETFSREDGESLRGHAGDIADPSSAGRRSPAAAPHPRQRDIGNNPIDRSVPSITGINRGPSGRSPSSPSRGKGAHFQASGVRESDRPSGVVESSGRARIDAPAAAADNNQPSIEGRVRSGTSPLGLTYRSDPPELAAWHGPLNNHRVPPREEATGEKPARTGPQVHIGTVVIRAAVAPSAPPVQAPPQQNTQSPSSRADARTGGGPTAPDSLARSLAWSYGLIQG